MSEDINDYKDEEPLAKAYDPYLMRRLLGYAKKYWVLFALAALLILASTLTDLIRPYLLKVAIDDYLNGYKKPMIASDISSMQKGVVFEGKVYQTVNSIAGGTFERDVYSIFYLDKKVYLVNGVIKTNNDSKINKLKLPNSNNLYRIIIGENGKTYNARELNQNEVELFMSEEINGITRISLFFIGAILLGFVLNFLQIFILSYAGQTIIYNLRQEVFSHIQKLPLSYFDKNPVGRLVTRVTNDAETLNDMYTNVLVSLMKDVFMLIGIILIMFKMDVELTFITLGVMPLVIITTIIFKIKAREIYRKVRIALARINSTLSENISGIRIIQIFAKGSEKLGEFKKINNEYYKSQISEIVLFGIFRPLIEMIAALCIALLIWYGGGQVIEGTLQFGVLFAFINYVVQFFQPINDIAEKYNILQSAMASSERIFEILDVQAEHDDEKILDVEKSFKGSIEFKDVWFAYNNEEWVLRDLNFSLEPGKTLAIVGSTGAGKTSVISLINRLYEIQKGEILIDGKNIKNVKKETLRRNVGVVLQDVFLFGGTIKDNIRLNEEEISDERIKMVSEYVNANKFIESLPNGYDEEVKERGATFSSGQRQLLAFARALAFNPSILILDEATANIDTETEILIQDALNKITKDRTTIVIAHRLSTIQHADNIIVLHKGKIREIGNHQELLAHKGLYYNLYQLQYKGLEA